MKYYLNSNPQRTGEHELHKEGCKYLALANRVIYIGDFLNCRSAIISARSIYSTLRIDGCAFCCPECHTT